MVLILVLIIVVMVSLAGFSFVATMHNEDKATRLRGEELQAEQLVQSGVEMIQALLDSPAGVSQLLGGGGTDLFRGVAVYQDEAAGETGRFTVLAPRLAGNQVAGPRYGLENESAKLNLTALLRWEQRQPNAGSQALMQLPGMTEAIADALLDWVDADNTPRGFGAEAEYYEALSPPYAPRNGPPECLDELLLVRDVTRQLLYGGDDNRNDQLEPEEAARLEAAADIGSAESSIAFLPWSSLLTVHSAERNVNPQGQPRIDLNDSDLRNLHRRLRPLVGVELADFVVAFRQYGGSAGGASGTARPALDLSRPARYRISSALDLVDVQVRVPPRSGDEVRVLESPLQQSRADFRANLLRLLDHVTVLPLPVLRGRININLAAAPVLKAIPGMDPGLAERIVSARSRAGAGGSSDRRQPVWLLFERMVDLPRMKNLLPYLTCGGDVYRAQIVGFFDSQGPTARAEVVFDATQTPAHLLYAKDLRILGRGYAWEILGAAAPRSVTTDQILDLDRFSDSMLDAP